MSNLTDKQLKFVEGRVHGLPGGQAAIAAGYAVTSAAVTASQLLKRPDIQAAIRAGKKKAGKKEEAAPEGERILKDNYASSLELLQDSYNNKRLPPGLRIECAKLALPYEHGRVADAGKKVGQKERAKEVSKGKFGMKSPPPTRATAH